MCRSINPKDGLYQTLALWGHFNLKFLKHIARTLYIKTKHSTIHSNITQNVMFIALAYAILNKISCKEIHNKLLLFS